jgi:hypothetical protein
MREGREIGVKKQEEETMKRGSLLSAGLVALALAASACSESTSPSTINTSIESSGNEGILAMLQNPQVMADAVTPSTYHLLFTAGASGASDSEPMVAARTIETVAFEIHAPNGALIAQTSAREVATTGVTNGENSASLTVIADTEWEKTRKIDAGSYVIGYVHGHNGELLVTRAPMPVRADQ